MIYDLQKASLLKRVSAWLLDFILLICLAAGFGAAISDLLDFDSKAEKLNGYYDYYEQTYGVDSGMTEEKYNGLTEAEQKAYQDACDAANKALTEDDEAMQMFQLVFNLTLVVITFSLLLSILVMEFFVPLLLNNGQTVGKKVFGIAVMRTGGVRVNGVCMFIRVVLGKFAVETMIPVYMMLMLYFGMMGGTALVVILVLVLVQLLLLIVTHTNSMIHDKLADTVTVDMASQMIFDTEEDLLAYKKRVAAEKASKDPYA